MRIHGYDFGSDALTDAEAAKVAEAEERVRNRKTEFEAAEKLKAELLRTRMPAGYVRPSFMECAKKDREIDNIRMACIAESGSPAARRRLKMAEHSLLEVWARLPFDRVTVNGIIYPSIAAAAAAK